MVSAGSFNSIRLNTGETHYLPPVVLCRRSTCSVQPRLAMHDTCATNMVAESIHVDVRHGTVPCYGHHNVSWEDAHHSAINSVMAMMSYRLCRW